MRRPDVDVLWIARYDYPEGWGLRLHRHSYYQMILFLDGKGVFTVEDQPCDAAGKLFLVRPNERHGLRAQSLVRTLDVKFRVGSGPLASRLRRAARSQPWSGPALAARFERIRTEGERKQRWYRELCGLLLAEVLYLYLRNDPDSAADDPAATEVLATHDSTLQRALAFIHAQCGHALTVRDVAGAAGCTDRTLRLHFRSVLRTTPLDYLQRTRIERSKVLIQYSDYSLKEIAKEVGFRNVHHFTRLFTAMERTSPAAWRQWRLEGIRKDVYIHPRFENRNVTVAE